MKKALNIEVAGVCSLITVKNEDDFMLLNSMFGDFSSHAEPHFMMDILSEIESSLNMPEEDLVALHSDLEIGIRREGENKFKIFSQTGEMGEIDMKDGKCCFCGTPGFLFTSFYRTCFQIFLLKQKGFLLHACGVISDGRGYIFTGPSGSGKSTIASLSKGRRVLSDESVCIKRRNGSYYLHPAPFDKWEMGSAKLEAIFFPRRGGEVEFVKVLPAKASLNILPNLVNSFFNGEIGGELISVIADVSSLVSAYEMYFPLEALIWDKIKGLEER
ncbi:MAG TPA: hypothetical protein ENN38_03315 [Actinobacteria bacterium]|nr:hypothetical protein [Actinomycetota bacterium]